MSDFASALLLELGRATLALTLAAGLAFVILRWAGLQSPRLHRALWLLVLLVGWTLGGVPVAIPWHHAEPVQIAGLTSVASVPHVATDALGDLSLHSPPANESSPVEIPATVVDATPPILAEALELPAPSQAEAGQAPAERMGLTERFASLPWSLLVVTAWLAGIGALVAVWLFGYLRFVRAIPIGKPCPEAWQQQWRELLDQQGVRRPIAMRVTVDTGPLLCRLPRGYELLIPCELWTSLDPAERQSVLQHELAHYLRGDLAKSLGARLLALPHWFNPCAWLAVRRFDEAAEWACDQAAAAPAEVTTYARALVRLGEVHLATRYGSAARTRPLASRVRRLLKFQQKDSTMKTGLIVAAALCLAALAVVRVQLVAREAEAPAESSSEPTILTIEVSKDEGQPTDEANLNPLEEQPKPTSQPDKTIDNLFKEPAPTPEKEKPAKKFLIKPNPKSAAQRAVDAAREAYLASKASWESGNTTLEEVCGWSKRWMTTAIAAAADSQQCIEAAKHHLERMKSFQEKIQKLSGIRGLGEPQQVTAINFYVAEAESQVAELQTRIDQSMIKISQPGPNERVVLEEVVERRPDGQEVRRTYPRVVRTAPGTTVLVPQSPSPTPKAAVAPQPPMIGLPPDAASRPAAAPTEAVTAEAPPKAVRRLAAEPSGQPTPRDRVELPEPTSFRLPTEADPRLRLRYDGKSFRQWKEELANELSTAKRTQAVWALMAFGNNGYGKEAAETIMELMGSYSMPDSDPSMKSDELSTAALNAFGRLPREAALPVVLAGLKSDKVNQRLFAVRALPMVSRNPDEWKTLVVPYLNDADPEVRASTVESLGRLGATTPETVKAVRVALADVAPQVVHAGFRVIGDPPSSGGMGMTPRPDAVWCEALVSALGREEEWIRKLAAERLLSIGVKALPDLDKVAAIADAETSQRAKGLAEKIRADADQIIAAGIANVKDFGPEVDASSWDRQMLSYGEYAIPHLEKAAAESKNPAFVERVKKIEAEIRKQSKSALAP